MNREHQCRRQVCVTAAELSDAGSLAQLERFEGMRVSASQLSAVSGSDLLELPTDQRSGLITVRDILDEVPDIRFVHFGGEDVVRQATEIGVARFRLVVAERCVAHDVSPRKLDRLRSIAREADHVPGELRQYGCQGAALERGIEPGAAGG
mgnify:CR=1 FL=1